jgi:hypothetical protein
MTARELINASLRLLGVSASGEPGDANEIKDALEALNLLLASASANRLLIPYENEQVITTSTARTVLAVRPVRVAVGSYVRIGDTDYPVEELTVEEYAAKRNKGVSGRPAYLCWDKLCPVSSLYLYPEPDQAYELHFRRVDALSEIASLDSVVDLPGPYIRALKYALAIEVAPEFGRKVPDAVAAKAAEALNLITKLNARPVSRMAMDIPGDRRHRMHQSIEVI